jgi:hypothetical protein
MTLIEILHTIQDDKEKGLVNIDDWKWADADHLKTMGFDFDGDYVMSMKDPSIKVYKKKSPQGEIFMVEAEKQQPKAFQQFDQVVEFFDHYSQPEIDKERD